MFTLQSYFTPGLKNIRFNPCTVRLPPGRFFFHTLVMGKASKTARDAAEAPQTTRSKKPRTQQQPTEQPAAADAVAPTDPAQPAKGQQKRKAPAGKQAAAAAGGKEGPSSSSQPQDKPPFYLVKSEPHEFSLDQLKERPNQTEGWEGVRNAQARNFLKSMRLGDRAFFYHSSCKVPGIVGIVEVVREAYPDSTAQDSSSKYFDAKASPDDPRWFMVDFKLVRQLKRQITLEELKGHKEAELSGMALFNRPRLSVQPVTAEQWDFVMSLEDKKESTHDSD